MNRIILKQRLLISAQVAELIAVEAARRILRNLLTRIKTLSKFWCSRRNHHQEYSTAIQILVQTSYGDVKANPTASPNVQKWVWKLHIKPGADSIVALGGGPSADTAKVCIGVAVNNPASQSWNLWKGSDTKHKAVPDLSRCRQYRRDFMLEVTINCVDYRLSDARKKIGSTVDPNADIPAVAIVDPELM